MSEETSANKSTMLAVGAGVRSSQIQTLQARLV